MPTQLIADCLVIQPRFDWLIHEQLVYRGCGRETHGTIAREPIFHLYGNVKR